MFVKIVQQIVYFCFIINDGCCRYILDSKTTFFQERRVIECLFYSIFLEQLYFFLIISFNNTTNLFNTSYVDNHLTMQYNDKSFICSSKSSSSMKFLNWRWFFALVRIKFTILKTGVNTCSKLKCLAIRCSRCTIQWIGIKCGMLSSFFKSPISPTFLPTIAAAPSVATLINLSLGTFLRASSKAFFISMPRVVFYKVIKFNNSSRVTPSSNTNRIKTAIISYDCSVYLNNLRN